jgi:hypothetical protein
MTHDHVGLITAYRDKLAHLQYSPVVVHNYSHNADLFLSYLEERFANAFATNTARGYRRSAGLLAHRLMPCCGKPATSAPGTADVLTPPGSRD